MDDRFFEAWITRSHWRVCGLHLQPLCLGHIVNLAAVGSPLLPVIEDPDIRITTADLLIAARICSETFPHPGRLRPRLRDLLWRYRLDRSRKLFERELLRFAAFRADHTSFPQFWQDVTSDSRQITAPAALSKAAYLLAETSLTEARVWSMPLARVDFLIGAIEERRTGLLFLDDDDLQEEEIPLTEDQIIAQAQADLPEDQFQAWLAARRANRQSQIRNRQSS